MLFNPRRLRLPARILLTLLLALSGLLAVALYLLQRNPEAFLGHYIEEISTRTGLSISVEAVHVALLPLPSLAVSNASVENKEWRFSVARATLVPDFPALLRGELTPRSITLVRPHASGLLPVPLRPQRDAAQDSARQAPQADQNHWEALLALAVQDGAAPALPDRFRLAVEQGEADLMGADQARLSVDGLQCDLETRSPARLRGRLSLTSAELAPPNQPPARLDNLLLEGGADLTAPLDHSPQLKASGALRLPHWLARLHFALDLQEDDKGLSLMADLQGDLLKDDVLLPFQLAGTAAMRHRPDQRISLENLHLALGRDSGSLDGTLRLGGPDLFALRGRLLLHRASLTQWLGFARNLAPGLQLALDHVSGGVLDFSMDGNGLHVPQIEVSAAGSRFTGSGGVASWARPEVALDLKSDQVNLGRAIPESVGVLPETPPYGHDPLTPMPGAPLMPGETGVDYHIRLAATRIDYGPIVIDNGLVVIKPGLLDPVTRQEDTLLLVEGRLYDGSVKGETILGGGRENPYSIRLSLRNVNGKALAEDLPVIPVSDGRLRGDVDIISQGRKLDVFLGKLRGTVSARAERGALRPPHKVPDKSLTKTLAFKTLDVNLKARAAAWDQSRLGLEGQWKASLTREGLQAAADLNGRMWFSGDGAGGGNMDFQNLPGTFTLDMAPEQSFEPEGLSAQVSGKFSCQAARAQLSASEARISALGVEARGAAQISAGREGLAWQGRLAAFSPDMARTLRLAGLTAAGVPAALRRVELDASFKGDADSLSLTGLRAKLDQTVLTGAVSLDWRKSLSLNYKLATEQLDLDRCFADKETARKGQKGAAAPWDLRALRAFAAQGELRVGLLTAWKLKIQDLRLASKLENGRLRYETNSARFYGAPLASRGTVIFAKGLDVESAVGIEAFDLAAASADRGGSAVLEGRGTAHAEIQAQLTGPGQLPARLNGKWRFNVLKGAYQRRDKEGRLKGKPTRFEAAGSSGSMTNGIARSDDFYLQGTDLKVEGGGWIDLNKETLDCNFTVNMKNLPDFPLRLYGSLDDSKTSIGAGRLILNTIGGITMGFVDVLGSVVQGAWKIFR